MARCQTHRVSAQLGIPAIHDECRALSGLDDVEQYEIDVSQIQHLEPISMLLLGSAIRRLKKRNGGRSKVLITGRSDNDFQGPPGEWASGGA